MKTYIVVFSHHKHVLQKIYSLITFADSLTYSSLTLLLIGDIEDESILTTLPCDNIIHLVGIKKEALNLADRDTLLTSILSVIEKDLPHFLLFDESIIGQEIALTLHLTLGGSYIDGVMQITQQQDSFNVIKSVYNSNLKGEFLLTSSPYIISALTGQVEPTSREGSPEIEKFVHSLQVNPSIQFEKKDEETGLKHASLVVAGGRGIGSKEEMDKLQYLASLMHGELGASRPAVLNNWVSDNRILGASGISVKPKITINVGISGSSPYTIAIEKSELIISINNDRNAKIFSLSDVGIVEDASPIIKELTRIVIEEQQKKWPQPSE